MWPQAKYTQKPRAEQIYLLCRGATVYAAHKGRIAQKPRAEQIYLLCLRRDSICGQQAKYKETRPHTDRVRKNNASCRK